MATRSPKSSQRSGGGAARSGGSGRKKAPARRTSGSSTSRTRKSARKTPTPQGPIEMFFVWMGQALMFIWRMLAHTVGGIARAVGRSARDLDPDLRRDGMGMVLLALGLLIAAAVWWDTDGPLPEATRTVVVGAFGAFSPVLPLLFIPFAWRLMRTPGTDRSETEVGRLLIGYSALMLGLLGLIHIAHGIPWPADGADKVRAAGGIIGFAASGPLSHLITPWITAVLLCMVFAFGLLVVTATPVHRIPQRLAGLLGPMMERDGGPDAGLGVLDPQGKPKRKRKPRPEPDPEEPVTVAGDNERPYDTPVVAAAADEPPAKRTKARAAAPPDPTPAPEAAEQLSIPSRVVDGDYELPAPQMLKPGTPPKPRTKANDTVVAALDGVMRQFNIDAEVTGFTRGRRSPATRSSSDRPSRSRRSPRSPRTSRWR